ncbi:ATP-binding cassette domain-containing protein, partial [Escherichia coli]|uniref:ATP-binding cassette domain-containing protein n=1 Tax=Escherichia coli TaxID=562 RepID=UPI0021C5D3CC
LKPQNDMGRVLKARQLANCGFILQHPMGLKFPGNFMAKNLSSGQQQQLLLARSLSSDASVFLWDEPTSNLDENTEKQIF